MNKDVETDEERGEWVTCSNGHRGPFRVDVHLECTVRGYAESLRRTSSDDVVAEWDVVPNELMEDRPGGFTYRCQFEWVKDGRAQICGESDFEEGSFSFPRCQLVKCSTC
jgi:hypothetical protein